MFKERSEDTINAKGRLNDPRRERVDRLLLHLALENGQLFGERKCRAVHLHVCRASLKLLCNAFQLILWHFFEKLLHCAPILFEGLHDLHARFLGDSQDLAFDWFFQRLFVLQVALGRLCMSVQVESRAIGNANAFQPPIRTEDLRVPTVASIVCHLCRQMLAEANILLVQTNVQEKLVRPYDEECQGLIVDETFSYSVASRHLDRLLS
mmetsp:Transcript_26252/g.49305  ORF Transcript_26252/g.49305 Transcript_26252/m.49305 type:complete len:209 (-) Transcript_26252:748-1374(-)